MTKNTSTKKNKISLPLDKSSDFPTGHSLVARILSFSKKEKIVFTLLILTFLISSFLFLNSINRNFFSQIPAKGGLIKEGIVGTPRFINPIFALSEADRDVSTLVFSGLLRPGQDGEYLPDLAESFEISENGTTYTVKLKDDIYWHDGNPVTVDDVIFTINRIQDPIVKSPRLPDWVGVELRRIDAKTIAFSLSEEYSPFLENLTTGIIPKHLWEEVDTEQMLFSNYNINAIGSGAYKIESIGKDRSGIPNLIKLSANKNFSLGEPLISKLELHFFESENALFQALNSGKVMSTGSLSAENVAKVKDEERVLRKELPRVFGVFFNPEISELFQNKELVEALELAINKENLSRTALFGFATPLDGPLPTDRASTEISTTTSNSRAMSILEEAGWQKNEDGIFFKGEEGEETLLSFSLSTSNAEDLARVANELADTWSKIGIAVEVKLFEPSDLNQNVIRPRNYEALLFGEQIGRYPDPFPFWHSSQTIDPGLNIAIFKNPDVDNLLSHLRTVLSNQERSVTLEEFSKEVSEKSSTIFLYAPEFSYIAPEEIKNIQLDALSRASDRFLFIHEWYKYTDTIWKKLKINN